MKTKAALLLASVWFIAFGSRIAISAEAIEPYIDDRTILVARLDLDRIDLDATRKWVEKAARDGGADASDKGTVARRDLEKIAAWVGQFRKAGGKSLYAVISFADVGSTIFYMAPIEPAADAKALSTALTSLVGGQSSVLGNAVFAGDESAVAGLPHFKPSSRPELTRAFAEAGDAPIRLAIIPSVDVRRVMEALLPPEVAGVRIKTLATSLQWGLLAIKLPPEPSVHIQLQSTDAESATQTAEVWAQLIALARKDHLLEQVALPDLLSAFPYPLVVQGKVVDTLDSEALAKAAAKVAAPFIAARNQAVMSASTNNIRLLLLACMMHANNRKDGAYPDSLDELLKTQDVSSSLFDNPRDLTRHPGYVYVKPPPTKEMKDPDPSRRLVIYEAHDPGAEQIVVGFGDGHVEVVNEEGFKKFLAEVTTKPAK
jgi:hypothetical protein